MSSLFFSLGMTAQGALSSTGTLSVSKTVNLEHGGNSAFITVAVNGPNEDKTYTAYQMDIILPAGILFDTTKANVCTMSKTNTTAYPSDYDEDLDETTWHHQLAYNILSNNTVRIECNSNSNKPFKSNTGDLARIYLKATPFAKPGDFQVTIKDIKFVSPDETKYLYQDQVLTAGTVSNAETSVPVRVTAANKVCTAIFPFSCDNIPAGIEVYSSSSADDEYISLTKVESIAAFTPYIIYSDGGFDGNLNGTIATTGYPADGTATDGCLTGVLHDTEVSAGYVLQKKDEGTKFYKIGTTPFTIPAGKCYANPKSSPAKSLGLRFDDGGTTGITSTTLPHVPSGDIYDLQGRKILTPQSGQIYVIGGQKFLKR